MCLVSDPCHGPLKIVLNWPNKTEDDPGASGSKTASNARQSKPLTTKQLLVLQQLKCKEENRCGQQLDSRMHQLWKKQKTSETASE